MRFQTRDFVCFTRLAREKQVWQASLKVLTNQRNLFVSNRSAVELRADDCCTEGYIDVIPEFKWKGVRQYLLCITSNGIGVLHSTVKATSTSYSHNNTLRQSSTQGK
ncbi:hypothetical protein PISMIDRAFT_181794 [Pisolithus microcarpus 441]|uniref:Uncharacterized protein n=1 Tax=Pisolithus microcarpus 441 TaxID=765257 RepID=A0A0C9Y1N3_9AGAM|nr:hypothetical protein PISMIDRAFT_181794 [Pisolithus microcarpus 441]